MPMSRENWLTNGIAAIRNHTAGRDVDPFAVRGSGLPVIVRQVRFRAKAVCLCVPRTPSVLIT